MTVSASRKNLSIKVDGLHEKGNPSPIAEMKDSLKSIFPLDGEKSFYWQESLKKIYTGKVLFLARKLKKWFPLTGKCFSFKTWFPRILTMVFDSRKKGS